MGMLDGKVCIVTGGGRGIGRATALLLAREGAKVVVNDVPAAGTDQEGGAATGDRHGEGSPVAQSVVDEIVAAGGEAVASVASVADREQARSIVRTAVDAFGGLHVVVNNAGILRGWSLLDMTEDEFDAVVAVSLKGTFNVTSWAASYWRERSEAGVDAGRAVVNTSSGAGLHGTAGQANYAAAKAGVAAMTMVHAHELGGYGVRVNCVAPIARTRMAQLMPGIGEMMDLLERPAFDPENVAPLVAALAADGCPFTGQVFSVVGGSVGIYAGWSIAESVTTEGRWTPADLARAMDALPRAIAVNSQKASIAEALR